MRKDGTIEWRMVTRNGDAELKPGVYGLIVVATRTSVSACEELPCPYSVLALAFPTPRGGGGPQRATSVTAE